MPSRNASNKNRAMAGASIPHFSESATAAAPSRLADVPGVDYYSIPMLDEAEMCIRDRYIHRCIRGADGGELRVQSGPQGAIVKILA